MQFFTDKGAAETECAYRNLYSLGQTYCVTDGPGDEDGVPNFAVMELAESYGSMFHCWIMFGDGSRSGIIENQDEMMTFEAGCFFAYYDPLWPRVKDSEFEAALAGWTNSCSTFSKGF